MPAGSICGSRVRYAGYGRRLTCAVPGYYSQCRSITTSTIVKRRWHVLHMLSGAMPSTWALALALGCVVPGCIFDRLDQQLDLRRCDKAASLWWWPLLNCANNQWSTCCCCCTWRLWHWQSSIPWFHEKTSFSSNKSIYRTLPPVSVSLVTIFTHCIALYVLWFLEIFYLGHFNVI